MIIIDKERYKMAVYDDKREVHAQIFGFIREDMVSEYLEDLTTAMAKGSKSYSLIVDATHQSPLPSKTSNDLGNTFMFYRNFGFKQVYIIYPKSKIGFVQVRNALEDINFPEMGFYSVSEIR